ncbi:integrase [Pararhizobium capsulatum DSM 1112]|uniref:Integrase n=1 Tax=Pararhizobium capsulatum DSM 1112 TaxID=1121113 RepID=A0ABU0BTH8_9HYPH|nr:site-specific integrase [Pararhizobium capsulatum]MDQ0320765.1 integrase [Pararhizobium capsulatum DSM 1112]
MAADDNDITSKKARSKLAAQNTIYWKTLKPGLYLGYAKRKSGEAGIWIMRTYLGTEVTGTASPYQKQNLGKADDFASNDCLSFAQAQAKAFELQVVREKQKKAGVKTGPMTVAEALEDYLANLKAEGKATVVDARRRIDTHFLPTIGKIRIEDLTTDKLIKLRNTMATEPVRLRTAKGQPQKWAAAPVTPDEQRARRSTVNRTFAILKRALNRAYKNGRVHDATAWQRVERFRGVDAPRERILTVEECQRLVNAADAASGLRDLIHGALLTGCRYGELCRLKVADFQNGRLAIHKSKSGKPRDVRLTAEGRAFFAQITAGRKPTAWMFSKQDGRPWGDSQQGRPTTAACLAAGIEPTNFHQLRHTYASLAIMNGTPLMVVAQNLGHKDTSMVQKFYGHLTVDYQDDEIERGAPKFGIVRETNVVPFKEKAI